MQCPVSYQDHPFTQLESERAMQAFRLPAAPPPSESVLRLGGYELHIDEHLPQGTPRGTVLMVHGAGANGRLLWPFAAPWTARGFRVQAPDLPGYGITRGDTGRTSYCEWIELVAALAEQAASRGPVVLFGLSVGGLTVLRAAQRARSTPAAVVVTTLIDLADPRTFDAAARWAWLGRLARLSFRLAPQLCDRLALPLRWVAPLEKLTSDAPLARLLASDPLLGARRIPLRFMRSLHEYVAERPDYDLGCPLLLVHPGADLWTPLALSLSVFERIRSDKELVVLSAGSHAPLEPQAYAELDGAIAGFLARYPGWAGAAQARSESAPGLGIAGP